MNSFMSSTPVFSVVIVHYNKPKRFWTAAIDSVLEQDYPAVQLVFADDCTPGFSYETVANYIEEHKKPNLVDYKIVTHDVNCGTVKNINDGDRACDGDYVLHLNADDALFDAGVLSSYASELKSLRADEIGVFGLLVRCDSDLAIVPDVDNRFPYKKMRAIGSAPASKQCHDLISYNNCVIPFPSSAFLMERYREFAPLDERMRIFEDLPFIFRVTSSGMRMRFVDRRVMKHRDGGISTSGLVTKSRADFIADLAFFYRNIVIPFAYAPSNKGFFSESEIKVIHRRCELYTDDSLLCEIGYQTDGLSSMKDAEEKAREYERIKDQYGSSLVIASLARKNHHNPDRVASLLSEVAPTPEKSEVKTVALYYTKLGDGGVEKFLATLAHVLVNEGFRVVVITDEMNDDDYDLPAGVVRASIPPDGAESPTFLNRIERWGEIITRHVVDAVVYNRWVSKDQLWDILAIKEAGAYAVLVAHGSVPYCFSSPRSSNWLRVYHELSLLDRIVVLSRCDLSFWSALTTRASFIPNPSPQIAKDNDRDPSDTDTILWIGRLSKEKQPIDAVRAFALIHASHPSTKLKIVGKSGDGLMEKKIEAEAELYGLKGSVELCGYHKDVDSFYREASLILCTSLYESFCISLYEAFAHGVPAAMYELPYLEITRFNKGFVSSSQGDYVGLARNAIRILDDRVRLDALSQEASAVADVLSSVNIGGLWSQLFTDVCEPGPCCGLTTEKILFSGIVENIAATSVGCIEEARRAKDEANRAVEREAEIQKKLKNSNSWKVGRAVTCLPRRVKSFLRDKR